jgi:hypothetical protein
MTNEMDLCLGQDGVGGTMNAISLRCFNFIFCCLKASQLQTSIYLFLRYSIAIAGLLLLTQPSSSLS